MKAKHNLQRTYWIVLERIGERDDDHHVVEVYEAEEPHGCDCMEPNTYVLHSNKESALEEVRLKNRAGITCKLAKITTEVKPERYE